MMLSILRQKDENLVAYMIRLYENREAYGLSNQEVADLLNREDDVEYDESRWRKLYQAWANVFEPYVTENFANADTYNQNILDNYEMMRIELQKEKVRFQDQKREYNKMIRESARFEHLKDVLREEVKSFTPQYNLIQPVKAEDKNEIVVLLADWHVGETYSGTFNEYNLEVFHKRIEKLSQKIHQYLDRNPVDKIHIASLGDQITGQIHISSRVSSEVNVIEQIKVASEALAAIVSSVADRVKEVEFYSVIGNHSRLVPNKSDLASTEESFEKLLPWYLEVKLSEYDNVNIHEDRDGFIEAEILGENVLFVHGDIDSKRNPTKLARMLKKHVSYIFMGHTHSQYTNDDIGTKIVVSPSLMGDNDYSVRGRFGSVAAQTVINLCQTDEGIDEEIKILNL